MELAIGIVIGVVVTIIAGLIGMTVAGGKAEMRDDRQGWKRAYWQGLVSTECVRRTHEAMQAGGRVPDVTLIYALASAVEPDCIPNNLLEAACDFVGAVLEGDQPAWVRYVEERAQ